MGKMIYYISIIRCIVSLNELIIIFIITNKVVQALWNEVHLPQQAVEAHLKRYPQTVERTLQAW